MKNILPLLCAAITSRVAQGGSNQRRVPVLNSRLATAIEGTEIASLMISREEGTTADASSRTPSCSSHSTQWLRQQVKDVSDEDLANFFDWQVHVLPFAYKLFVQPTIPNYDHQEYFGLDGEYTEEINSIHDQVQEFWATSGVDDDIRVLCAHGSDLADRHEKLIPALEVLYGGSYDDDYTIFDHATDIQELITRLPGGYNFPLLTFNAFATDEIYENGYPSIIIGDGYFEFQRSMGLASEGPEYALTHEHAHHLQFTMGLTREDYGTSQGAKRQELMADAFSAYFLAHDSGGDMMADEIDSIHRTAYAVGDCEISNDSHHGTPHQRSKCCSSIILFLDTSF